MLKLESVSKEYLESGGRVIKAIRDVSIEIKKGEFVAFVGPSGCGKSTLLKIIAGLVSPTEGKLHLSGKEITETSLDRGMMFQHYASFPWLSVFDNVAFGLRLNSKSDEEIENTVNKYLKLTGLYKFRGEFPSSLSGGMQQRMALARLLANDSEVLLLDEPFGALDVQTRSQMQELLERLWEKEKKTTILVTHDVSEAIYLADRVVILSTKPGTVKEVVDIPIERPRRSEVKFSDAFLRLKKHVSYVIRSEHIKASLEENAKVGEDVLTIGLNIWPGNTPFYIAKDKGFYLKRGLEVELINLERNEDRIIPWKSGDIDLLNVTLDTALRLKRKIDDLEIVSVLNQSVGGDAVVSLKEIKSIKELKGKRIALEKNWVSHFFINYLLSEEGLQEEDVELINMKGADIGRAVLSEEVDAGVLWEPWLSRLHETTKVFTVTTSREHPVIFDVLVAKRNILQTKKSEIGKIKEAWRESVEFMTSNKDEGIQIGSSYLGISERDLEEEIKTVKMLEEDVDISETSREIELFLDKKI